MDYLMRQLHAEKAEVYALPSTRGCLISQEDADTLADVIKGNKKLWRLSLNAYGLGDKGTKAIAAGLRTSTTMTELFLCDNAVGDEGVEALAAALEKNTTLTTLRLCENNIGVEGAKALASAIVNTTLATLDLSYNNIGDEGAVALASALASPQSKIKILELTCNPIHDEGAKALATALITNTSLVELYIDYNHNFTADGIQVLAESAARSLKMTRIYITCQPELHLIVGDALARAVEYRKVLALMSAVVPGRPRSRAKTPASPAEGFVMRDGDFAIAHRVTRFLVGS